MVWHHGGGYYFHRDYVFCGPHDYARAGKCYHYRYTGDADNCHGGGGERTSATSAWSIRTRASPTTTTTTLQDDGNHLAVHLAQHSKAQRPQRTGRAHDHGRHPVNAKRSCTTEVSSGEMAATVVFYSTARRARPSAATRRITGCSANTSASSSRGLLGPVHMGTVKHIWHQICGTPDLLVTSSQNSNFELIGFSDGPYSTGNPEKAKFTSGSMYFLSGASSTPALASSATRK